MPVSGFVFLTNRQSDSHRSLYGAPRLRVKLQIRQRYFVAVSNGVANQGGFSGYLLIIRVKFFLCRANVTGSWACIVLA